MIDSNGYVYKYLDREHKGMEWNDRFEYLVTTDPDFIEDPAEFDEWTSALIQLQTLLIDSARDPEVKDVMARWLAQAPRVRGSSGEFARGTPREIQALFPKLIQQSVEGELFATTRFMSHVAAIRATGTDHVSLTLKDLPARSGFVTLPEGAFPSDDSWISIIGWAATDSFVLVMWWECTRDNPEHPSEVGRTTMSPFHIWGMKFDGSIEHGRLAKPPYDDELLMNSYVFLATGVELIKMLQEEINTTAPITPRLTKPEKRKAKKALGKIPTVRTYDLRRRVYPTNNESNREGHGCGRELETSHRRRGHYRRINKGTPQEYLVWVKPSVVRPDLKPTPQTDRIGLLRR